MSEPAPSPSTQPQSVQRQPMMVPETSTTPATTQQAQAPSTAPSLTPEQQEFMNILNDLIMSAQELSYALVEIDQTIIDKHPELKELIEAAKNVVRNVKRFHRFVKARARR